MFIGTAPHPICTPCGSRDFPLNPKFLNCSFFSPPPPSPCPPHCPHSYPPTSMPQQLGPWSLDNVKAKLRQEQVEREKEASARYRRQEAARRAKQETVGETSFSRGVLCFVLLSVVVLALCAVILSLLNKENENR